MHSGRPDPGEYRDDAKDDIAFVDGDDAVAALREQRERVAALLADLREEQVRGLRYAPGKWTLKEVVGHLSDFERIFSYRALCLARGETAPLQGYDGNAYAAMSNAEERPLRDVVGEYLAVRASTLALFESLAAGAWLRRGSVSGYPASVRGLAFQIAAHELHHLRTLLAHYLQRS
jgi:DinB superfamily